MNVLSHAFSEVEGLYTNAEYREIEGYRFQHDAKPHNHDALSATIGFFLFRKECWIFRQQSDISK
jgi:hypothetical protein